MEYIFIVLLGMIIGACLYHTYFKSKSIGYLNILDDTSDPEFNSPYLFVDLDKPVNMFRNEKYVVMKIKNTVRD